jgi:hypothetical protein
MAVLGPLESLLSFQARQKVGIPNQYGRIIYGVSRYGEKNDYAGIYQTRPRPKGRMMVRMVHYVPTNPQTIPQQTNRQKYADSVAAWQALSSSEKQFYRVKSSGRRMSGYNLFQHEYLISH